MRVTALAWTLLGVVVAGAYVFSLTVNVVRWASTASIRSRKT